MTRNVVEEARRYAEHHGVKPWTEHIFALLDVIERAKAWTDYDGPQAEDPHTIIAEIRTELSGGDDMPASPDALPTEETR